MRFLFSTENTENENFLFSFSSCLLFSFSLKMFSEIKPNTFSSPFSVFSGNENRKQLNQTPPKYFSKSMRSNGENLPISFSKSEPWEC